MEQFIYKDVYMEDGEKILEINILPEKYCNFDCIFCPIGRSIHKEDETVIFPDVKNAIDDLGKEIERTKPDVVFINSKGEALIHDQIEKIIHYIKKKNVKVRLLSNGYLLGREKYMQIANLCDEVLGEIKIVDEALFQRAQRPIEGYTIAEYVQNLITFRKQFTGKFLFEVTILNGYNDDEESLHKIKNIITDLAPDKLIIIGMEDERFVKKLGITEERMEEIRIYLS